MIDLHTHSIFSDGTDSPEELVARGLKCGLRALALTDHDTVAGLECFRRAAVGMGIEPINGVELSAGTGEISLHLLGYGFDPDHEELMMFLERVQTGRAKRNEQILQNLNRLGYEVSEGEVRAHAGDELVGRPHFAAVLIQKGYFRHPRPIFEQLLGRGKAAYVDRARPALEECVALIRRAGGAAVLAHPGQTGLSVRTLRRLLRRYKEAGLVGLEAWHPSHRSCQTRTFLSMCDDLELIATGGSDAHGSRTPDVAVGIGRGDLHVPDDVLDALRKVCLLGSSSEWVAGAKGMTGEQTRFKRSFFQKKIAIQKKPDILCTEKGKGAVMKRVTMIVGMVLILAGIASAAFQYEVVVADQYAQGNTVSGRDFFVRVTQGSGTLYMLDHINTLWSDHQTQAIANHVSAFGFYNLTTGESGMGSFDNTIITYQQAMNPHNPVVTQTGYAIGSFSEGDEIAIWITDNNGVTGASVGERGDAYVDNEMNWRNWGVHSDRLGNPAGQFSFSGSSAIFFGLTGVQGDLTGVPLPGAIAVLLIGGAFLSARRKGVTFARAG